MKRENSKSADLMLRMYESVIFPGKCIHLTGEKRRSLRSVWAYDISYLYPRMEDGIDWMKFGLFESQKLDRKVPFYNRQQELFLEMAEKSSWIEQFVEYPEEIVYEEEFTLTFTPDLYDGLGGWKCGDGDAGAIPTFLYTNCTTQMVCPDGILQGSWLWMCTV